MQTTNEGEEERDGKISEPMRFTKMQENEGANETAKELRASLPHHYYFPSKFIPIRS